MSKTDQSDQLAKEQRALQLDRLLASLKESRVLRLQTEERLAVEQAVERARAQLLEGPEPILLVALTGGTGAGKSSLINALAGSPIAAVSALRPTTQKLCVYHHHEVTLDRLPEVITSEANLVPHDRPELRTKVLIDTPDLDSFVVEHRALTKELLKAAGLVLYAFSPEKYLEERTWSVLREEQAFSASAAILNKIDLVSAPEERELLIADLRRRFASLGLGDIRIFQTSALAHMPAEQTEQAKKDLSGQSETAALPETVFEDDTGALRAFLERELQASDVAQMQRTQQERVVTHLSSVVERLAPEETLQNLEEVSAAIPHHSETAADQLVEELGDRLAEVQQELVPVVILRQHERFWGPLRTWFAVSDFLRFRLAGLTRQLFEGGGSAEGGLVARILLQGGTQETETVLQDAVSQLQDRLYQHDLPLDHWRSITSQTNGSEVLLCIATEIETRFHNATRAALKRGGAVVWVASFLGGLAPSVVIGVGLYVLGRDFLAGEYVGLALLGHLLAMVVLFFGALQGITRAILPGTRQVGRGIGRQAVRTILDRTLETWVSTYQTDLEADLHNFREPLHILQSTLSAPTGKRET